MGHADARRAALPVAADIDRVGYHAVDVAGSSLFEVQVRYRREDPWEGLDLCAPRCRPRPLRAGTRSNGIVGFGLTPDSLMDLWVRTLVTHGIDSFWIYDCLFNIDKMARMVGKVAETPGAEGVARIMYGTAPVHTDEYFAEQGAASWPRSRACDRSCSRTRPGCSPPERAATLLPAIVAAAGDVPARDALPQHHRAGARSTTSIGVEAGRHDRAHRRRVPRQRAVDALGREHRSTTCADVGLDPASTSRRWPPDQRRTSLGSPGAEGHPVGGAARVLGRGHTTTSCPAA